jgi:hypothetical protein
MVDENDHRTGLEGLTVSVYIRKSGELGFTLITNPVTDTGFGSYEFEYTEDQTDTVGDVNIHCEAIGADDTDFIDQVIARTGIRLPTAVDENAPDTVYCSLGYAESYFATRLDHLVWDGASEDDKTRALSDATRRIDRLNFQGSKADADQLLEFPRGSDTEVPDDIKIAACEIAYALLDGVDVEIEAQNMGQEQVGFGMARTRHDRSFVNEAYAHNIPSVVAWSHLKPYLRDRAELKFFRVS